MSSLTITPVKKIQGIIEVPGDKSISHRAVMLASIAEGRTEVNNFLMGQDCLRTIDAFKEMGIKIDHRPQTIDRRPKVVVEGKGLRGLKKPNKELYFGNSGTTMRIILGILAGQDFECVLSGDESLSKRPMRRVVEPLEMMGAEISSQVNELASERVNSQTKELYPPLRVKGKYPLKAIKYKLPIPSAQVKSAILLAGLYADGITEIEEPLKSRDHTERMLKTVGAKININGLKVNIERSILRSRGEIFVPGDISSAAFFLVASLILGSSKVTVKDVGVNPTRTGVIDILRKMGAEIEISNVRNQDYEPMADVTVRTSKLRGINIEADILPRAIDELPIIMVAAAFAKGTTVIEQAGELRVKETDRISSMTGNLKKMGADIEVDNDTIIIRGLDVLKGAEVDSFNDHRTAMCMAIAGLRAEGKTIILNTDCINKSFPHFEQLLSKLI